MGNFDDLIPNKGGSSSAQTPTAQSKATPTPAPHVLYGIYSDLIPKAPAPTPEKPGFLESVKNFFTGKKEAPAPAPEPTPPPAKAGIYQDLIPAPKAPEAPQPSFLDKAGQAIGNVASDVTGAFSGPTEQPKRPEILNKILGRTVDTKTNAPVGELSMSSTPPQSALDRIAKFVTSPFVNSEQDKSTRSAVVNSIVGTIDDQKYTDIGKSLGLDKTLTVKYPPGVDPKTVDAITKNYYTDKTIASYVKQNFDTLSKQYHYVDANGTQKQIEKPVATDPNVVEKNLTDFTKALGVRDNPTLAEVGGGVIMLPVVAGLLSNPITTVLGVAGWEALSAVEHKITGGSDLSTVVSQKFDLNEPTSNILDLLELFGKGKILHSIYTKSPGVAEQFLKNTATTYNMEQNVYIDPAKVKDIFQTGTKISAEENALIRSLGLDAKGYKDAIQNGVTIKVPAEKLVTVTDKPYWAKFKEAIGKGPSEPTITRTTIGGEQKPTVGPRALIEAPKGPIEPTPAPAPVAEPYKPVVTPRGTVLEPPTPEPVALPKTNLYSDLVPVGEAKPTEIKPIDVASVAKEAEQYGVKIDTANVGKANNEIDMQVRYLNDKPAEAMASLGYSKGMQTGGNADFVSQRLLEIKDILNKTIEKTVDANMLEHVAQKEASIRAIYHSTGPSSIGPEFTKAEEELSNLTTEMQLSVPGQRLFTDEGVKGIPSTFPSWVPDNLRSTDLFNKVITPLQKLETIKYPEGNRPKQRALVDAVLDQLDARLGVDTSHLRSDILNSYDTIAEQRKLAKVSGGSVAGGEGPRGANATQREQVAQAIKEEPKTIKQIAQETKILEPNVRRILGVGAKEGTFARVDKGIYRLSVNGEDLAYIETGSAVESLPRLASEGFKSDLVFLDIPYDTPAIKGGSRGAKYDLLSVNDFGKILDSVKLIARSENTPVIHMFSQAKSGLTAMTKYNDLFIEKGFVPVGKGEYQKTYASGKPVGFPTTKGFMITEPEGILVFTQSGKLDKGLKNLNFRLVRPSGYQTEKPAEMLKQMIEMTTNEGDVVLDPFAGSGVTGAEAIKAGRKAYLIEKNPTVAETITKPRIQEAAKVAEPVKGPSGKGGNYSIGTFRDGTTPLELGGVDKVKVIELPEMVQLARELMGEVPKIRERVSRHFGGEARGVFIGKGGGEIRLRADLFDPNVSSINQAAKTLAHEIGHLTDYLPNLTLKRGNLMGRLLTLSDFRKDFLPEAGQSRTDKELRQQLWDLSKYWKPVDEATAPASFIAYRKSAKEVYADFISVLFNDPKLAADKAPTAYNLFFEHLDKKPLVRDAYFEAQALLSGDRMEVIKARRAGVQQMFKDGDYKAIELQNEKMKEREKRNNDLVFKTKFELIDKNAPLIDRVKELEKKGVVINPDDNPVYYLEERNYLGGKIKAIMETDFSPVYDKLQKAGITWGTFGEELFYQRIIAGDRSSQANPRGITPSAAQELHDALIGELTPEQAKVLADGITQFRDGLRKVADEAYKEGLYTPELYKQMQENPAYVTFQVIDHLENAMTSKVYKSIGTLKDITNPADASILKMIATVHAIERNKVSRTSVDFLKEHFPLEVEDAKTVFSGKNGRRFIDSKQPYNDTVIFYRDGKMEGYYVDSYIKKSIDNESVGQTFAIISGLRFFNSHLYRPLFIGFNLGFQSFNFVRDFKRFYKNIPDMTILRAMQRYHEAYPIARTRSFGPKTDKAGNLLPKYEKAVADLTKLERDRVFSVTFNDILAGANEDEAQIERILRTSGIDTFADPKVRHVALRPFVHVLEFIKRLGDLIETLPKAAGFFEISSKGPLTREQTSYIRKNIGSPDFLAGGHLKPATNEIFLFSNAITQGIRSDYNVATNPKTRSAYWWKTMKLDIIPKLLMLAGGIGLFGQEIKKIMEDTSEYDKTNYTIIPLGTDSTGKSIYFRMPSDEGGRLIGGLFWKTINASNNEQPITKDLADIASFAAGQIPNISPTITAAKTTFDYLSGQNPYDSFRGRNVLSDDVFKAGGWRANKAFLGWMFNQVGGGVFYRFGSEQAVPTEQGPAEKLFNLPVVNNVVGRFFRVTDYGTQEHLTKIRAQVQSEEARQRLNEIDAVNATVKVAQQDKNLGVNRRKYELQLVSDYFGHPAKTAEEITTAKRLIDRFRTSLQKGGGGAEMNALIGATSNEQKVTVLREIKKNMTADEFTTFKKEAIHNKIASPEVFHNATQ